MISSFKLFPYPPFRLDYTVWALRRREHNIIDQWNGHYYTRVFLIHKRPILVTIEQTKKKTKPEIIVSFNKPVDVMIKKEISQLIEKMFGLTCNLQAFYKIALQDRHLKELAIQFMGVKPVRFASLFESLLNAIACQQLSLEVGILLLNRLSQKFGKKYRFNNGIHYAFPSFERIKKCTIENLKSLGFNTHKSQTIIQLASSFSKDRICFDNLITKTNNEIVEFLCQYKGIGRWSAEYTLLRGLGRIDIFPGDDVGARNNLQKLLQLNEKLDYQKIAHITKKWHPYAGLVYYHFLLNKLSEKGLLASNIEI